jgi:hypothetical protein
VSEHPTSRDAHDAELALIRSSDRPLYNQTGVAKPESPRWNGKVYRNRYHGVWFGKWRDIDGKRRVLQVPSAIQDEVAALAWLAERFEE